MNEIFTKIPPQIILTTPESLDVLLSTPIDQSNERFLRITNCLKTIKAIIIDESIEKMVTDLGLNEKQAKDFKAAMEEMRPAKNKSDEKPSREEMQKKKKEVDAKIKSILTDEQYKKYLDMRKKDNAKKKKKAK
jgi:hypothetical protein